MRQLLDIAVAKRVEALAVAPLSIGSGRTPCALTSPPTGTINSNGYRYSLAVAGLLFLSGCSRQNTGAPGDATASLDAWAIAVAALALTAVGLAVWSLIRSRNDRRRLSKLDRRTDKIYNLENILRRHGDAIAKLHQQEDKMSQLDTLARDLHHHLHNQEMQMHDQAGGFSSHQRNYARDHIHDVSSQHLPASGNPPGREGRLQKKPSPPTTENSPQFFHSAKSIRHIKSHCQTFNSEVDRLMHRYHQIIENGGGVDAMEDIGVRVGVANVEDRTRDNTIPPVFDQQSWGDYFRVDLDGGSILLPKPRLEVEEKRIEVLALRKVYEFADTEFNREYEVTSVEEPALLRTDAPGIHSIGKKGRLTLTLLH